MPKKGNKINRPRISFSNSPLSLIYNRENFHYQSSSLNLVPLNFAMLHLLFSLTHPHTESIKHEDRAMTNAQALLQAAWLGDAVSVKRCLVSVCVCVCVCVDYHYTPPHLPTFTISIPLTFPSHPPSSPALTPPLTLPRSLETTIWTSTVVTVTV